MRNRHIKARNQDSRTQVIAMKSMQMANRKMRRQHKSREAEHNQALRESEHAIAQAKDAQYLALEELQCTKDELEKAINDRNEMQELLESRTSQLSVAQSFMSQTDYISAAEVTQMVRSLNHDILQVAASFADTPRFRRTRQTYTENKEDFQRNSRSAIGEYLTTALTKSKPFLDSAPSKSEEKLALEPDTLIQIAVQVCMVRWCCWIATTWTGVAEPDTILSKIYSTLCQTGM